MDKKIDSFFAAVSLIEILYEQGLVNKATLEAKKIKSKLKIRTIHKRHKGNYTIIKQGG